MVVGVWKKMVEVLERKEEDENWWWVVDKGLEECFKEVVGLGL